ncbi:hypothetical protein BDQ17DRAFT_1344574 [Cyathus striatus]|nr:hypothetical protein BDQ17DRAFT_1344574 [Cyathus striatus]
MSLHRFCLAIRWTLAQTTVRNAREHQNILFDTGYSTQWFADLCRRSIVRVIQMEYDHLILAGMHFIAIFICFGNAAILDSLHLGRTDDNH